jgi:hypothetical protein
MGRTRAPPPAEPVCPGFGHTEPEPEPVVYVPVSEIACVHNTTDFVAGNIGNFIYEWQNYTTNNWILKTIELGYDLEFETIPIQEHPPKQIIWSENETECIQLEVDAMFKKGAVIMSLEHCLDLLVPLTK